MRILLKIGLPALIMAASLAMFTSCEFQDTSTDKYAIWVWIFTDGGTANDFNIQMIADNGEPLVATVAQSSAPGSKHLDFYFKYNNIKTLAVTANKIDCTAALTVWVFKD